MARAVVFDHQDSGGGSAGFKATEVDIYFSRGSYQCAVFEGFIAGSLTRAAMIAQARALAKIIVDHIR